MLSDASRALKCLIPFLCLITMPAIADEITYDLTIDYKTVNITGKDVEAMTINGQLPGPTLRMTESDDVTIRLCSAQRQHAQPVGRDGERRPG